MEGVKLEWGDSVQPLWDPAHFTRGRQGQDSTVVLKNSCDFQGVGRVPAPWPIMEACLPMIQASDLHSGCVSGWLGDRKIHSPGL